jgi:8-oxo-dGTP pyrophosphatase MutT (NUDIX family)
MDPDATPSIDDQLGLPGEHRPALALACARELLALDEPSWHSPAWQALDALDAADGFANRRAARALLQRSDGRFLLFRYPFADGSWRWIIPGGGAEVDEAPRAAVIREVEEETGATPRIDAHTGVLLYHVLATSLRGGGEPKIQYSPLFTGVIDDELPDNGGREVHWLTPEEFAARPHRPISTLLITLMRSIEAGEPVAPAAVWLPV